MVRGVNDGSSLTISSVTDDEARTMTGTRQRGGRRDARSTRRPASIWSVRRLRDRGPPPLVGTQRRRRGGGGGSSRSADPAPLAARHERARRRRGARGARRRARRTRDAMHVTPCGAIRSATASTTAPTIGVTAAREAVGELGHRLGLSGVGLGARRAARGDRAARWRARLATIAPWQPIASTSSCLYGFSSAVSASPTQAAADDELR